MLLSAAKRLLIRLYDKNSDKMFALSNSEEGVSHSHSVEERVSHSHSVKEGVSHSQSVKEGVSHSHSVKEGVSHSQSVKEGVSHSQSVKEGVSHSHSVDADESRAATLFEKLEVAVKKETECIPKTAKTSRLAGT